MSLDDLPLEFPTLQIADPTAQKADAQPNLQAYQAPQVFIIGKAVHSVLGYTSYKYSDGYTGYTWER